MTSPLLTQPVLDRPLNEAQVQEIRSPPAMQQPAGPDAEATASATAQLAAGPGIVPFHEVQELKGTLARVASGQALALQIGDCAESFDDSSLERLVSDGVADFSREEHDLCLEYAASNCAVVAPANSVLHPLQMSVAG